MLYLFLISAIINIALGWSVFNVLKKLEYYEDFFEQLQTQLVNVLSQIKGIDLRGAFEADDEVGLVFQGIKGMINTLGNFLTQGTDVT